jgi:putative membrane protein
MEKLFENVGLAAVFAAFGILIFTLAFVLMAKLLPHFMRKEIEDDQNTALAVVTGSVILGIAIIIAAAIH